MAFDTSGQVGEFHDESSSMMRPLQEDPEPAVHPQQWVRGTIWR